MKNTNTTITIKVALLIFSLSALIITQKNHCMEIDSGNVCQEQKSALDLACEEINAEYHNYPYSSIEATITIPQYTSPTYSSSIGYGDQSCIDALNKANIPTNQRQPLTLANIITTNNTDLTTILPLKIRQEIHAIKEKLHKKTEKKIKSLYSSNMTAEQKKDWMLLLKVSIYNTECFNALIKQVAPPVMPIHLLSSSVITTKLFNRYNITFLFDEQQQLSKFLNYFYNTPQTITMLTANTIKIIKECDKLSVINNDHGRDNEIMLLNEELRQECITETGKTNKKLKEANIINCRHQSDNQSTNFNLTEKDIVIDSLASCTHGTNNC